MCLAIPGRITAIKQGVASVDYGTEEREASIVEGSYRVGEYVIVQGKIIVMKVDRADVKNWCTFYRVSKKNAYVRSSTKKSVSHRIRKIRRYPERSRRATSSSPSSRHDR